MAKGKRQNRVKIPGSGQSAVKVPISKKDPTVAPTGSAFTPEDAMKHANAALKGLQQVLQVMGIRGYFIQMVIPCVEWRKDINMPDGSKVDDFVFVGKGVQPAFCSGGDDPRFTQASGIVAAGLWEKVWGAVPVPPGGAAPAPADGPTEPPLTIEG